MTQSNTCLSVVNMKSEVQFVLLSLQLGTERFFLIRNGPDVVAQAIVASHRLVPGMPATTTYPISLECRMHKVECDQEASRGQLFLPDEAAKRLGRHINWVKKECEDDVSVPDDIMFFVGHAH